MADIIRNEVIDAVLTRQTIREYKPIMLTDAQLDTLTAAAMMAPSGRNCQPCHVRFICNDAMLRQMQIDFKNIVGWDTPVHTRSDKNPFYHNAPVFAAIFAKPGFIPGQITLAIACEVALNSHQHLDAVAILAVQSIDLMAHPEERCTADAPE